MINPANLPQVVGNRSVSGAMPVSEVQELQKALEAGYGSDVATLEGGGALRIQSLEKTMMATIQENRHFVLFNELAKSNATATVDEWTEQSGVGGFLGGTTNSETGNIASATGEYARRVGLVKYLMTRREVSFVQTLQNAITEAEAVEYTNGALQLLTDAEFLCFEGDSVVVPTEYDGIRALIESLDSADHVIDAEGEPLNRIDLISRAAATIAGRDNFGIPTHFFSSQLVQADLDISLDPAYRVSLNATGQDIMLGAPVVGMRTSWGQVKNCPDVFIRDEHHQRPFELEHSSLAAANAGMKPQSVAGVAAGGPADSKWGAPHAGTYYYAVAGVSAAGQSAVTKSAQVTVAAGEKVTLTITGAVGGSETGYAIYRGRRGGTNDTDDFRLVKRIAKTGATTEFVDLNREVPGGTTAYMLNLTPGHMAITWRQMLPMTKFSLYPTASAVVPWAQLLFGYLRISKRRHHIVIKNIIPNGAAWRPF